MNQIFIPNFSLPEKNRKVLLVNRSTGIPEADDFALEETAIDPVEDGKFLVRNIYLSVDPAQRGWVVDAGNYSEPVAINSVMRALAVGVIIESRHPDYKKGDFLYGWLGWQDYSMIGPEQVMTYFKQPEVALSAYAGVLGMNGLTAYLALSKLGRPLKGETVLVSTAAGAVGSVVGQLAKHWGCRSIGLTGDDQKVALCTEQFGYDIALNYKIAPVEQQLAEVVGDGVDVYFDNVGGTILDASLRTMRTNGRIVQCGTASIAAWSPSPQGPRNEREILTRRLVWSGFVIFDHMADLVDAGHQLEALVQAGVIRYEEDIDQGMEYAPGAIASLYSGANKGKKLIYIG